MPLIGIARMAAASPLLAEKRRVSYFELSAKSFIGACNSPRVPFDWTVNPYRGCEYGCLYCYARYTHEFMELDGNDFETRIFAKHWDPIQFRREARRLQPGDTIAFGTATDCYQPAERRFQIMRRMLESLIDYTHGLRIFILTKSDLPARDIDLLSQLARRNDLRVSFTITTLDAALARKVEPYAPCPELRLNSLRHLSATGITTGVSVSPILPRITDDIANLDSIAAAVADAGGRYLFAQPVFLKDPAKAVFLPWLQREFPALLPLYKGWFAREAYIRGPYAAMLKDRVDRIRRKHGLTDRSGPPPAPAQLSLFH